MPTWTNSPTRSGWNLDPQNARLDFGYRGTRIGHLNASGMTLVAGGLTMSAGSAEFGDDLLVTLGNDNDQVLVNRSTSLSANTALTGVLVGTPVTPAIPANSLIISNITASGDVVIAANRGGNSEAYIQADASAGVLTLWAPLASISMNPTTDVTIANGTGLIVGATSQQTVGGTAAELQVLGTGAADSMAVLAQFNTSDSAMPRLALLKSGASAIGSFGIVALDESLGAITWYGDDGTDYATPAAQISAAVDNTPGTDDMPGRLVFATTADSGTSVTERMRITSTGLAIIGAGAVTSHANMTGPGLVISQAGNDTLALALKSSDVATGLTSGTLTLDVAVDDYATLSKYNAAEGGLLLQAVAEDGGSSAIVLQIEAYGATAETTDTTASVGLINLQAAEHDAANATIAAPANQNIFTVRGYSGANTPATRLLLKGDDGELHLGNATPVGLDHEDDVMAVRALQRVTSAGRGIIDSMYDPASPFYDYDKLRELGIVGPKDERGEYLFALQPRLALHEGALWQLYNDLMDVAMALPAEIQAKITGRMAARLTAAQGA